MPFSFPQEFCPSYAEWLQLRYFCLIPNLLAIYRFNNSSGSYRILSICSFVFLE